MNCAELEDVASELALGIADGAERAAALSHLAHCPRCQQLVEDLGRVADDLLLLGPEVEPPLGFEARVHERTAAASAARGKRSPRLRMLAAAAVFILVAAAGGLVIGRTTSSRPAPAGFVTAMQKSPE